MPVSRAALPAVALLLAVLSVLAVAHPGTAPAAAPGTEPPPAPPVLTLAPGAQPDGALAVVAATPTGASEPDVHPTITFSRPVVTLGQAEDANTRKGPATLTPAVPGAWHWIGSSAVEFVPDAPLPLATAFTVEVAAGLTALDGTSLTAPYRFSFETPRPRLLDASAMPGLARLHADETLSFTFDQPVRDLAEHVRLTAGAQRFPLKVVRETNVRNEERRAAAPRYGRAPDRGFEDRRTRYELKPVTPLPLATAFQCVIGADLAAALGPLTMGADRTVENVSTYGPLRIESAGACWGWDGQFDSDCPWGPLVLKTTNRVDMASLKRNLTITPAVQVRWDDVSPTDDHVVLPARYRPGTRYTVTIGAGVEDQFGQRAPAFRAEVALSDVTPRVDIDQYEVLIEAASDGTLPVRAVNVPRVDARIWTIAPSDLARFRNASETKLFTPPSPPKSAALDFGPRRNVFRWKHLDLRQALPAGRTTGLFVVELNGGRPGGARTVTAQITDLAVHAKLGPASSLAWVTRVSSAAPVEGAEVVVYDGQGAAKARATTGADGVARLPGLAGLVNEEQWGGIAHVLVAATKDGDTGVVPSDVAVNAWQYGLMGGWEGVRPEGHGLVTPERGVYRPGEDVLVKGVVRYRKVGALRVPAAGSKAVLKAVDPRGNVAFKSEVALSRFGTFDAKVPLGADAPLGWWNVQARVAVDGKDIDVTGSFRVEEYRAPQFQVDVRAAAKEVIAGDPLAATASARYLFGGAMSGAAVNWSATRRSIDFEPPGHPDFTFGVHTWGWDDDEPRGWSDVVGDGTGTTDAAGAYAIAAGTADAPAGRTFAVTLEAEVTDVSRQRIANRAEVTVHPAAVYAGVRAGDGFAVAGRPADVTLLAAKPDGALVAGLPLTLDVARRTWKSIRKNESGSWFTVSEAVDEPVTTCKTTSAAADAVPCAFTPDAPGLYKLTAAVVDGRGRTQKSSTWLYAAGAGWVSWQQTDDMKLELVPDRASYAAGDVAKVLVKSPFPEAEALVTVEREGVLSVRRVHVAGSAQPIEIPLDESAVPNVYVSVVLVRGRVTSPPAVEGDIDPGRPAARVGIAELKVDRTPVRLAVAVTPERTTYKPRETVNVALRVTDAKGAGAPCELAVWAVDEGVLRLTAYELPDLVETIFPFRPLSVSTLEALVNLLKKQEEREKGEDPVAALRGDALYEMGRAWGGAGGEAAGSGFRSQFKTTAFFAGSVITDGEGAARVSFTLPDNLTTFRVMALAVTESDRFGSGTAKVEVKKPLLALPATPRFSRSGDRFEAGVVVHRDAPASAGPVDVTVTVNAEGVSPDGPIKRTVPVTGGKPVEVRFGFAAEAPGRARLRFAVAGGGERDGVEQVLPVILPAPLEATAVYGDTRDRSVEGLTPPNNVRADAGGLEVTLASSAMGGYGGAVRQLVEYPYGCAEQLSSRLIPFVAMARLQKAFGVAPVAASEEQKQRMRWTGELFSRWFGDDVLHLTGAESYDEVVTKTIAALTRLQSPGGGFRYWPSDACPSPYVSGYVVLALANARAAGYAVDDKVLTAGQQFLADVVAPGTTFTCDGVKHDIGLETRTVAVWVLARTGAPRASYYGELFAARERLSLVARAMLADAVLGGGGDPAMGQTLVTELMNRAKQTAAEVHFEDADVQVHAPDWSSDTRTTAIALLLLADRLPDHPFTAKIARWLAAARDRAGAYRNTQEAAFTLLALSELLATKEKDVPDFKATVSLERDTLVAEPFKGRSLEPVRRAVPIKGLLGKAARTSLIFEKEGTGVLYYAATLRYAPLAVDQPALDRGIVVQRWFEPWRGGGATLSVKAGDLVRLRVRVATSQERRWVVVEVPLPAGLESVDPALATSARTPRAVSTGTTTPANGNDEGVEGEDGDEDSPWATRFWSPFNHRELRDDRVLLFADLLPPGVHEMTIAARATTPGTFVLGAARAAEMYTPEVFGRSTGGTFRVAP